MKRAISFIFFLCVIFTFSLNAYSVGTSVYHKHSGEGMYIAVTFDDGPHPKKTPKILDLLAEYNIHATFFTVGQNIEYYAEAAKRILEEGHEIGNHTYSHPHMRNAEINALKNEIKACEKVINNKLQKNTSLFRPPEGVVDNEILRLASDMGYDLILWSVDTRDWAGTSAEEICENVISHVRPGDIILMHDYTGANCHTLEALKLIIPKLIEKGYQFVTVSELISK